MIDDIENIKLPVWVWHYFPTGNAIQIIHLAKRNPALRLAGGLKAEGGFVIDKLYFIQAGFEFSVEKGYSNIDESDVAKYNQMNTFKESHEAITTIFKSLIETE